MIGKTTNPILQKTEKAVTDKVPANMRNAFNRIVTAGAKVMYDQKTSDALAQELKGTGDPAHIAGAGVAKLLGMLMNQSKGTMPMQAAIPAATILLCEGLDFMEQAGQVKVDVEVLSRAMQAMSSTFLQLMGVTPEKFQQMLAKAQAGKKPGMPAEPAAKPAPQAVQSAPKPAGIIGAVQGA